MECWIPLFDIFLHSPCPESEASTWLQKSFNSSTNAASVSTTSFLSLLTEYSSTTYVGHSSASPEKRVMRIQTLPDMVQARILSFLAYDCQRFNGKELCKLARIMLSEGPGLDFWVKKAAKQLLDLVSVSNYEWLSHLNLDSEEDNLEDEWHSLPEWLRDAAKSSEAMVPWLPIPSDEISQKLPSSIGGNHEDCLFDYMGDDRHETDTRQEHSDEEMDDMDVGISNFSDHMDVEVVNRAKILKAKVSNIGSTTGIVELAKEIRELCLASREKSLEVLTLIEPWTIDDETASILISHLLVDCEGNQLDWPGHALGALVLPKLLALDEPCSRVLMTATIDCCKAHQKAAEYALVLPLMLRNGGINNPLCELITRILKECLHHAHVSSVFQKLLSKDKDARRIICLPCHRNMISNDLVWTESLFSLVQNMLNNNVYLTQDSVDQLVVHVCELSVRLFKHDVDTDLEACYRKYAGPL